MEHMDICNATHVGVVSNRTCIVILTECNHGIIISIPAMFCCNVTELCNVEFLYTEFYIK
jgi:hypothetical protein